MAGIPVPLSPGPSPARREALARRVRWLVAATITYNVIEAVVAITAGTLASSTALIGFGLDSVVEVSSALAVAWQFSATDPAARQAREARALRVIAVSFFALAAYVTVDAVRALVGGHEPDSSPPGIVLAALSLVIMPFLSAAQRGAGRELGSASAVADSKQTLLCTYLSAVLLVGLVANALLGWGWADPLAALVIAALAIREGRNAWRGDACCAVAPVASAASAEAPAEAPGQRRADAGAGDGCGCAPGCACCAPRPGPGPAPDAGAGRV
ncbi:cation transporter [Streptomyces sp. B6B3]|uniref:cation transporter n=1 Tax=Streptomyces sp. B6B3 TaxID=3153570 RepID=UPI00325E6782